MDEMTDVRELRADAPLPDRARLAPGRRRLTEALQRRTARRRPRTDWRLTAVGAAAAVAAAALIGGQLLPGDGDGPGPADGAKTVQVHRDLGDVDALLEAAARHAAAQPDPHPHAGQWVYTKTIRGHETQQQGKQQPQSSPVQESWHKYADTAFENGKEGDDHSARERYRFTAELPQGDPSEVLKRARASYPAAKGENRAQHDFRAISVVLQTYPADPDGMAAVLRALKTVDGVAAVDHLVTDAQGDKAIAVHGIRKAEQREESQLLFDPRTMEYVGDRWVALRDYTFEQPPGMPDDAPPPPTTHKGDVLINSLTLEQALVAHKGDRP